MTPASPQRPAPNVDRDNAFFWEGAREGELRIQQCRPCGRLQHPPAPMCPACLETDMGHRVVSGRGTVYSWIKPVYPPLPMFGDDLIVALVDLEEGPRVITNLRDVALEDITPGMRVEVDFEPTAGDHSVPIFRPAKD